MSAKKKIYSKIGDILLVLLGFIVILSIWYFVTNYTKAKILLPSPEVVFKKLIMSLYIPIGRKYTLLYHVGFSLQRVLIGFGISAVVGMTDRKSVV